MSKGRTLRLMDSQSITKINSLRLKQIMSSWVFYVIIDKEELVNRVNLSKDITLSLSTYSFSVLLPQSLLLISQLKSCLSILLITLNIHIIKGVALTKRVLHSNRNISHSKLLTIHRNFRLCRFANSCNLIALRVNESIALSSPVITPVIVASQRLTNMRNRVCVTKESSHKVIVLCYLFISIG